MKQSYILIALGLSFANAQLRPMPECMRTCLGSRAAELCPGEKIKQPACICVPEFMEIVSLKQSCLYQCIDASESPMEISYYLDAYEVECSKHLTETPSPSSEDYDPTSADSNTPETTAPPNQNSQTPKPDNGLNTGTKIGIALGIIFGIPAIIGAWYAYKQYAHARTSPPQPSQSHTQQQDLHNTGSNNPFTFGGYGHNINIGSVHHHGSGGANVTPNNAPYDAPYDASPYDAPTYDAPFDAQNPHYYEYAPYGAGAGPGTESFEMGNEVERQKGGELEERRGGCCVQ